MEEDQNQVSVNPSLVIAAYERKLAQANGEIVMLEALVNQQQQEIAQLTQTLRAQVEAAQAAEADETDKPELRAVGKE